MNSNPFSNWWSIAINGVIALLYAVLAIFIPGETILTIIIWFGIIVLIIGIAMLIGVINNIRSKRPYGTDLIWAILTIAIGTILTVYTQRSIEIFVIIIGLWALLIGGIQLYLMTKLDVSDKGKNTFLINGILTIIFGVVLFFNPFTSAKALLILTGIIAFIMGILMIVIAIKMKGLSKQIDR
jgi:uncharacterized membrane protein HdeD (DUF308 family)